MTNDNCNIIYTASFIITLINYLPSQILHGKKIRYTNVDQIIQNPKIQNMFSNNPIQKNKNIIEGNIYSIDCETIRLENGTRIRLKYSDDEIIEFLDSKNNVIPLILLCKYCKKEITISPEKITEQNKEKLFFMNICEKCKIIKLEKCNECNNLFEKKEFKTTSKNERLCRYCYDKKYFICGGCQKEFIKEESCGGFNGELYCTECWDLRFSYCEVCDRVYYLEELIFNEEFGMWHCRKCRPQIKIIKNYHYKPTKLKFLKEKYEHPLYLGVELEVEPFLFDGILENLQKTAVEFKNFLKKELLENFIYLKTDSSIHGFEIVTHPFTLKYAHKHIKWHKMLEWLIENHYTSFKSGRCGLHVHLDKNYFDEMDVIKMRTFFSGTSNEIFKFSRREGKDNQYCIYEPFNKRNFFNSSQNGRHSALNINTNKNTIEIRVFRGTLNTNRFIASLQFCDALANFIKSTSGSFFVNNILSEEILWKEFLDFAKRMGYYNHFIKYVKLIENGNINLEREI
jgi:hypothetical protein